jgi:hypothetical protein
VTGADSIRLQWLASRTTDPDTLAARAREDEPVTGHAFSATYNHGTRTWRWRAAANGLSPTFRADAGFVPQVDERFYQAGLDRIFVGGEDRWFNEITASASCDRTTDWRGARASWGCDFPIYYSGPWQLGLSYNAAPNREYYRGQTYENFRHQFGVDIRPSGAFSLYLNATIGGAVDFANEREGEQTRLFAGGSYNLFGRLEGSIDYNLQELDVTAGRVFTAHLTQGQVVYHPGLRTLVRAILQYTNISRDRALYLAATDARTRRLFAQYLFSYKLNPQTVFLVGYSDNASGREGLDLTRSDRTLFTKIGYAWVP